MTTGNETTGLPSAGTPVDELLDAIRTERRGDLDWRGGKAFSLVYNTDDPELARLVLGGAIVLALIGLAWIRRIMDPGPLSRGDARWRYRDRDILERMEVPDLEAVRRSSPGS